MIELTLKNVIVDPLSRVPYEISVCPARSSAFSIGVIILSTVKNAAKFAVYDEMMIKVKNHQIPPTILVEVAYITIIISQYYRLQCNIHAIRYIGLIMCIDSSLFSGSYICFYTS